MDPASPHTRERTRVHAHADSPSVGALRGAHFAMRRSVQLGALLSGLSVRMRRRVLPDGLHDCGRDGDHFHLDDHSSGGGRLLSCRLRGQVSGQLHRVSMHRRRPARRGA